MAKPNAAELQAVLTAATREAGEIIPADRELQALLGQIRAARPHATELVQEILDELRHATFLRGRGTRSGLRERLGLTQKQFSGMIGVSIKTLKDYPGLGVYDLEAAWRYVETHTEEIEQAIRTNREA